MRSPRPKKAPTSCSTALDATNKAWSAERGGRHIKIILAGRLVGIYPFAGGTDADRRLDLNVIARIRRAALQP